MDNIFLQISTILAITVSIAFVMRLLRQPLMVAYIVAGMVAGPLFLNVLHGSEEFFKTFAEFGIVLLLFIVGLSLNFEYIKKVGKSVLVGGVFQFLLTASLGFIILLVLNFPLLSALFMAVAVAFSSTIIVVKLLTDKKDTAATYGRFVIGLLLIQDIIAVIIMVFLNTFGKGEGSWYEMAAIFVSKGIILVAVIGLMARYVLPWLMDRVVHSGELLFIFTITWCFGMASLVYWAGFSIEIGAIVAGLSLGASPYQPQIASRIRPLRDFFIVLFFIVLGSEIQLSDLGLALPPAIILSAFVLIADPVILFFVMRYLGYTRRNAVLAGLTAAQVSEFGFILIFTGQSLGYLEGAELAIVTITALITIMVSSYFITYNEQIYRLLMPLFHWFGKDKHQALKERVKQYPVWLFGHHRMGWKISETLQHLKADFAVVEFNPDMVQVLRKQGIPVFFGDAADIEFLQELPLEKAKLMISTIPAHDDQKMLLQYLRKINSKVSLIATTHEADTLQSLYNAGADYVMMPHLLSGSWIADILRHKPWTRRTMQTLREEQAEEVAIRRLAAVH